MLDVNCASYKQLVLVATPVSTGVHFFMGQRATALSSQY
jgi:hypothetical protein